MVELKASREFKADARAPSKARELVVDSLADHDGELVHAVALVASELVSNAVLHGSRYGGSVGIELLVEPHRIRIQVADDGNGFDPAGGSRLRIGGFGLPIIDKLAHVWGVDVGPPHTVWCEVTTPVSVETP